MSYRERIYQVKKWAIRSFPHFGEGCEQIAQVTHQKWATMSKLLRSLTKYEQISESLIFLSKSLIHSLFRKKLGIRIENRWVNSQPWKNLLISGFQAKFSKAFFSLKNHSTLLSSSHERANPHLK